MSGADKSVFARAACVWGMDGLAIIHICILTGQAYTISRPKWCMVFLYLFDLDNSKLYVCIRKTLARKTDADSRKNDVKKKLLGKTIGLYTLSSSELR